ncbi:MAG: PD40 domain-containing protein [Acidobacteria bacterium]|nr:PD40 domain-containing protein [Acidobacteriota bacterium]
MKFSLRSIPILLIAVTACSTGSQSTGDFKIALTPARQGQNGIFLMNSDTTGGKLLTPDPGAQLRLTSWSPDGKSIAFFTTRSKDSAILNAYRMPFHFLLYAMDANGSSEKRLLDFPISNFAWSPDGRRMLYVSSYEDPQHNDLDVLEGKKIPMSAIYVLNLQTGESRRLTAFGRNCSGSWSPDGSQLALSFGTEQISDIYMADFIAQSTRRLTDSQAIYTKPAWSPDGRQIAYIAIPPTGAVDNNSGVYVMESTGANKTRISSMAASSATWSPDGKLLLLQSAAGIILTDSTGAKSTNPTPKISRPMDAQFTPDGKEIFFRSNHEGQWNLYAVELKSYNLRRITGKLSSSTYCLSPLQ